MQTAYMAYILHPRRYRGRSQIVSPHYCFFSHVTRSINLKILLFFCGGVSYKVKWILNLLSQTSSRLFTLRNIIIALRNLARDYIFFTGKVIHNKKSRGDVKIKINKNFSCYVVKILIFFLFFKSSTEPKI